MIASGSAPSVYGDDQYRKLNAHQDALAAQGVDDDERGAQIKAQQAIIDAELEQRWPGDIPMPDFWGGYVLVPETVEFWQSGRYRLHDRLRYRRHGDRWIIERLSP